MASQVYLARFEADEPTESICEKTRRVYESAGLAERLVTDGLAAIKTHFGEADNESYIKPPVVRTVVDTVRAAGAKPCLVETSTLYRGRRHNAYDHFELAMEHGFAPQEMGCPLMFVDGLRGNLHVEREVGLKHFDTVAVAGDFPFFPAAVIVTHVTGHLLGGYGGAIKNVAMGLASRAGKMRQHSAGRPNIKEDQCIACGACVRWCPEDAIHLEDKAVIDHDLCIGCGECAAVCPVGAVGFGWDEPAESFNEKQAEYAYGILSDKLDKTSFVNLIHHTTADCNCMGGVDESRVCDDVGVLASSDIVALDQASVDLCCEAHGGDVFEEVKPGRQYKAQLRHGEEIGLGTREYELVEV
jgi:hypothetical protein